MAVTILKGDDERDYRAFVDAHPAATMYHTLEWRDVLSTTYGYEAHYLVAKEGDTIRGVLPLMKAKGFVRGTRLVCLPFSHSVPVLFDTPDTLADLLGYCRDLVTETGAAYAEIRHGFPLESSHGLVPSSSWSGSVLSLSGSLDDIWKRFDPKRVRWAIRKAERSDLEMVEATDLTSYEAFYRLELLTRKRQGAPPYAFRFFEQLHSVLGPARKIKLYLAYLGRSCVAGVIVLYHGTSAIYGYGASSSDRSFLRLQPNNGLLWKAIRDAHGQGCATFDFGTTPLSNEGLLRFKSRWGTTTEPVPYYFMVKDGAEAPVMNREGPLVRGVSYLLGKLPVWLLARVGPFLLRQVA